MALWCAAFSSGCAAHLPRPDLASLIESGKAPVIVDVRSEGEYQRDHVKGALHIPFYSLRGHADRLPAEEGTFTVLYCEHGPRAGLGRILLWFSGYGNVRYLEGHMKAWRSDGLPVEYGMAGPME